MNEKTVSLCVIKDNSRGNRMLVRLADLHDDTLIRFERPTDGSDNGLISFPPSDAALPLDAIGLYEWDPYIDEAGKPRSHTYRRQQQWIEVVLTNEANPEQLVVWLHSGWTPSFIYEGRHDVLFVCCFGTGEAESILVPSNFLIERNEKYYLNNDCDELSVYVVNRSQIDECNRPAILKSNRNYLTTLTLGDVVRSILVRSKAEMIGAIVRAKISKMDQFSRKQRVLLKQALSQMDTLTIVQEMADRFKCSDQEARSMLLGYLENVHSRINPDNVEDQILDRMVENDTALVQRIKVKVEIAWQAENETRTAEAEKKLGDKHAEITAAEAILEETQAGVEEMEQRLFKAEEQYAECQKEIETAQRLHMEINERIRQRLQQIQEDKGAALVDAAFLFPAIYAMDTSKPQKVDRWQISFKATPDSDLHIYSRAEDVVEELQHILEDSCVMETTKASFLALFLTGTAAYRESLIIAGPMAMQLADAVSRITYGHPCAIVRFFENTSLDDILEELSKLPETIICFQDALSSPHYNLYRSLKDALPSRQFVFIVRHRESLLLEPASLFTELLPVFTEFFVNDDAFPESICAKTQADLENRKPNTKLLKPIMGLQKSWFADENISPLLMTRCARIHGWIRQMTDDTGVSYWAAMETIFVPLMICLRKPETIKRMLQNAPDPDGTKKLELMHFVGVDA